MRRKPRLFVGCSSEGRDFAYAVQANLENDTEVTVWEQDVFKLSETGLKSLLNVVNTFDFAVFLVWPTDELITRHQSVRVPRDNVIFEIGMFMGGIGQHRTYMIASASQNCTDIHLPSDLLGITYATFDSNRSDNDWRAALGPACSKIRGEIRKFGTRAEEEHKRLPWLYSLETMSIGWPVHDVEQNVEEASTVYLVTPDLYNDARRKRTIDTVRSNLERGVTYTYITCGNVQAKANIAIVQRNFATFCKQVNIYVVDELFGLMPTYNILVLEQDADGILRVFVELPVKDRSAISRGVRHLWAEADEELADLWRDRILEIVKSYRPLARQSMPEQIEN